MVIDEVLQRNFGQLLKHEDDGRSMLDEIFSEALGQSVTVLEVEATVELHADHKLPGLVIQSEKVFDALGRPIGHELAKQETLSRIATALMGFTRADWVICSISDGMTEIVFPIMRELKKKEFDDA